jgi:hypothetical protein
MLRMVPIFWIKLEKRNFEMASKKKAGSKPA